MLDNNSEIIELLDRISSVLVQRKRKQPTAGHEFNVFSALGTEHKEHAHCHFLYELLSQDGSHGLQDAFLREFFATVLKKEYAPSVVVHREYRIPETEGGSGRIDLLLEASGFRYPIEVKIHAHDQYEQIRRYADFAKKAPVSEVYYLTIDGHKPSEDSKMGIDPHCLSFGNQIRKWLVKCTEIAKDKGVPRVSDIITQYIEVIDRLTEKPVDDELVEKMIDVIIASPTAFDSARAIEKYLPDAKTKVMRDVFKDIEAYMTEMPDPLERIGETYWQDARCYYRGERVHPSLTYCLASLRDGASLTLRFEVDWKLYWGCAYADADGQQQKFPEDLSGLANVFSDVPRWSAYISKERETGSRDSIWRGAPWWLWWRYLPATENDVPDKYAKRSPDFKDFNQNYMRLLDPDERKVLMEQIFRDIDSHIETIRATGLY